MTNDQPDDPAAQMCAWYVAYFAAVVAFAHRRGAVDAEEIAAETFAVCWRRFKEVPPDAPLPWLYGTARRVLANSWRRERTERRGLWFLRGEAVEPEPSFDDEVLTAAFKGLRPAEREVLMLIAWEGLAPAEAAAVVGCSEPAFRVRLHRARRRFAELVDDADPDSRPSSASEGASA